MGHPVYVRLTLCTAPPPPVYQRGGGGRTPATSVCIFFLVQVNVVVKEKLEAKQGEEGAYLKGPQGLLPKMAYTGRLRPKGYLFQASGI